MLTRRGIEVLHDRESEAARFPGAAARGSHEGVPRDAISQMVDLVITLGGDGTLLSVARHPAPGVPVFGIDIGTLGFLTACGPPDYEEVLDTVLRGEAPMEVRRLLAVTVTQEGRPTKRHRVVNDAVIAKSTLARIATIRVEVGGNIVSRYRGDGLIVSTPTGSTAYNLSAGGPILEPTMPALVLTPIAPHALTLRPVVLPDTLSLQLAVENPTEVVLTLDGQEGYPVTPTTRVGIARARETVLLVRAPGRTFFDVLSAKLGFGGGRGNG